MICCASNKRNGLQFTVHSLQFTVHSLQFTVHSLQFTVYGLQTFFMVDGKAKKTKRVTF